MDKIVILGQKALHGEIKASGSKNAALPLLAASLLTQEKVSLQNIPDLKDIRTFFSLLENFGSRFSFSKNKAQIDNKKIIAYEAPYDLVRTMRASILVLGPLLARYGKARVSLPGGCAIGARPINRHLKALEEMGAEIHLSQGYVEAKVSRLKGAHIRFEDITVTGTENILMAATLAKGETLLENAAREPEVTDLALALQKMGAKIEGIGTETLRIQGVESLKELSYSVMPDRIEAGTFLIAACLCGGKIKVKGISENLIAALLDKLKESGAHIHTGQDFVELTAPSKIKATDISTQAYPGFATDFQAQFMALMTVADGASVITENIFENRFMHVAELQRLGAHIQIDGKSAIVKGVKKLIGAPLMATDLRASACLILAGLAAEGITEVHRIYHLDRGYEKIEKKFKKLGAQIKRVKVKY